MALVTCPECGKENVSNSAVACPACGFGIKEFFEKEVNAPALTAAVEASSPVKTFPEPTTNTEIVSSPTDNPTPAKPAKKRKIALFAAIAVLCIIIAAFSTLPVKAKVNNVSDKFDVLIEETKESLMPYIAILGDDVPKDTLKVSKDFIDGISSVKVMGYVGTIAHRYDLEKALVIDIMVWRSNDTVTKEEFYSFVSLMTDFFDNTPSIESYESTSDETYLWVDFSNLCMVCGWYADGRINLMWDLEENRVNSMERNSNETNATSNKWPTLSTHVSIDNPKNTPTTSASPKAYCIECGKEANYTYTNPFSSKIEDYCYAHYKELTDTLSKMEEDVSKSSYSKHTCEECSREGTHKYSSFTGQTEYYCTQHYEELMDMLEILGMS